MKKSISHVLFYIILTLIVIRFLYYLYVHYTKNNLVEQILYQWKKQTNGNIQKATEGVYTDDYFLSFNEKHDNKTHIHLITNKFYANFDEFITLFFRPNCEIIPTVTIGYVIKKNNRYLQPIKINQYNDAQTICYHMIKSFEQLDLQY